LLLSVFLLLLYSYSLEAIFFKIVNLTIIFYLISILLLFIYIFQTGYFLKIKSVDLWIIILIIYSLSHFFIRSSLVNSLDFIIKSLSVYFLGRYLFLDKKNFKYFKTIINIYSWITIIYLIINTLKLSAISKELMGTLNHIALGELIGIFILVNWFFSISAKYKIIPLLNVFVGFFVLLFLISSRGALISVLITLFIIYFIKTNKKFVIVFILLTIIFLYFNFFTVENEFIMEYPTLSRFVWENIILDASVVGNEHYLGRIGLYLRSLSVFKNNLIFGGGLGTVYSHNIFLEFASGLGIVGLSLFIFWLSNIFVLFTKVFRKKSNFLLLALFFQSFIYRMSSFNYKGYKSLFLFGGMLITSFYSTINKERNEEK